MPKNPKNNLPVELFDRERSPQGHLAAELRSSMREADLLRESLVAEVQRRINAETALRRYVRAIPGVMIAVWTGGCALGLLMPREAVWAVVPLSALCVALLFAAVRGMRTTRRVFVKPNVERET